MRSILLFALVLLAGLAVAQDPARARLDASPRHQEWVKVKAGNRTVETFVVYPEVKDKAPVVVLIHEIFGMSDWVEGVADRLAENGYIAVAPDLLSEMGPKGGRTDSFADIGKVREAIANLPAGQITQDLNAVCDYAKALPASNGKLSVAGFCWGGGQAFRFATNRSDLSSVCVFYGEAPDVAAMPKITAPVYGFYGGNDARITITVPKTQEQMRADKKTFEAEVYDGAGHGFMRAGEDPNSTEENRDALKEAWQRWLEILETMKQD